MRLHKDVNGYYIHAALNAKRTGVEQQLAELLVAKAHAICPYSKEPRAATSR